MPSLCAVGADESDPLGAVGADESAPSPLCAVGVDESDPPPKVHVGSYREEAMIDTLRLRTLSNTGN